MYTNGNTRKCIKRVNGTIAIKTKADATCIFILNTHIFRFIYPKESMEYGVSNACNNYHQNKTLEWSHNTQIKWGMTSWERH